ncbi:hypothetical protein U1Q18_025208, partial [Sarracenia purpurea var. burkii]
MTARRTAEHGVVPGRDCCAQEVRCVEVQFGGAGGRNGQWQNNDEVSSEGERSTASCSATAVRESDGKADTVREGDV